MQKTFAALIAVTTLAGSLAATPASAQRGVGVGIAAGLLGGAIASQNGYYGPGYYSPGYYGPGYYAPGPAYVVDPGYGPDCYLQRQRFWDGYGWRVRKVQVCN